MWPCVLAKALKAERSSQGRESFAGITGTTTGYITIALTRPSPPGLQPLMKMDLICIVSSQTPILKDKFQRSVSILFGYCETELELSLSGLHRSLADLLPLTLFFGGFFNWYAGNSSYRLLGIDGVVLAEERQDLSSTAIIPLKGAGSTVDDVDIQAVVNQITALIQR